MEFPAVRHPPSITCPAASIVNACLSMRCIAWSALVLLGCDRGMTASLAPSGDAALDAGAARAPDASPDPSLRCDPADTWLALSRGPGTALGDADPATPDDVGDARWHLFVGVNEPTTSLPDVYVYDATAAEPGAPFALPADPLGRTRDSYDQLGSETPSYLRADGHREYLYYCAIESYAPLAAHLAAYRRVDGGAWSKVGVVAPNASDELTVCEPTVVRDPDTGYLVAQYLSLTAAGRVQERRRVSDDPEQFPASTVSITLDHAADAVFPDRLAVSRDPYAGVWRTAYDLAVGNVAMMTLQTWSAGPSIGDADLDRASALHDGGHATHPALHTDATMCDAASCPQGAVLQPSKAIYPDVDTVVFYYAGWTTSGGAGTLQVNGQLCRRR